MSKWFLITGLALITSVSGCKAKKKIPAEGDSSVEMMSEKDFLKAMAQKPSPHPWVKISADISVPGQGLNAGSEIRLRQDSIIWMEVTALGIKAARGFAMADSVAFMNRLNKTWFGGNYSVLEQRLKTQMPFEYLFRVFQGQVLDSDTEVKTGANEYLLNKKMGNGNDYYAIVEPTYLDCIEQKYFTSKEVLTVRYGNFKDVNGYRYPFDISVEIEGTQPMLVTFLVKDIQTKGPYPTPFSIGNNYERMY